MKLKQFLIKQSLYTARWELSTLVLAPVIFYGQLWYGWTAVICAIVANFIGSLIFFWIDNKIFTTGCCEIAVLEERHRILKIMEQNLTLNTNAKKNLKKLI